jgi:hypothetical protein
LAAAKLGVKAKLYTLQLSNKATGRWGQALVIKYSLFANQGLGNEGHFPILENMKGILLKIFTY